MPTFDPDDGSDENRNDYHWDDWDDDWRDREQPQEEPYCFNCWDRGRVDTGWLLRLVRKYTRFCPDCRPTRLDIAVFRAREVLRRPWRRPAVHSDEAPF